MTLPFFQILQGSSDVTALVGQRNISLSLTDGVGLDADSVTYEIDDKDGIIAPPRTGVTITVIGGYVGRTRNFGQFIVDQVTLSGYPQKISVSAQSAGAKTAIKQKRPKSYDKEDYPTYQDIYAEVAGRSGLQLAIASEIGSIKVEYEAQTEENDLEFATRIGMNLDAHVSVKSNRLIVVKRGAGKSASGASLGGTIIRSGVNLIAYSVNVKDTPKHTKVKATYFDRQKAKREEVEATSGSEGPEFLIREPFGTKDEAERAAEAKAKDLKRIEGQANFTIEGDPFLMAESIVTAAGIRPLVDGPWRTTTVTHNWSGSDAYVNEVACEKPE